MGDEHEISKILEATNIESLPDDAICDILLRLTAQDIYEAARFVCSRWFHLARTNDFVRAHLHQSTHALLIQDISPKHDRPILIGARNDGRIDISNFEYYKFKGRVLSSCDGLVLETDHNTRDRLHVTNPVTKQRFALPTNPTLQNPAIAYAAAAEEYKVVHAFYDEVSKSPTPDGIAILTVGVDVDWARRVDVGHLSPMDRWLLREPPLGTQGFVHWAEEEFVLTLNVENEVVTKSRVPFLRREGERLWYYYLSTGRSLSVLIGRTRFSWEVWEMESETGEWARVTSVDLEGQKGELEGMGCKFKGRGTMRRWVKPVGWSRFGEVLVFSSVCDWARVLHTGFTFAYNVGTHGIESFEMDRGSKSFVVHRHSLVRLD